MGTTTRAGPCPRRTPSTASSAGIVQVLSLPRSKASSLTCSKEKDRRRTAPTFFRHWAAFQLVHGGGLVCSMRQVTDAPVARPRSHRNVRPSSSARTKSELNPGRNLNGPQIWSRNSSSDGPSSPERASCSKESSRILTTMRPTPSSPGGPARVTLRLSEPVPESSSHDTTRTGVSSACRRSSSIRASVTAARLASRAALRDCQAAHAAMAAATAPLTADTISQASTESTVRGQPYRVGRTRMILPGGLPGRGPFGRGHARDHRARPGVRHLLQAQHPLTAGGEHRARCWPGPGDVLGASSRTPSRRPRPARPRPRRRGYGPASLNHPGRPVGSSTRICMVWSSVRDIDRGTPIARSRLTSSWCAGPM
jgi:hypothetical protein